MGDFLKGFIGNILCWICGLAGLILMAIGVLSFSIIPIILAVIAFAIVAGIKYWLGGIVRMR
jgi:vacuolar-type H+-ATPase subunit I/STV1